jgi:hypothetical protein
MLLPLAAAATLSAATCQSRRPASPPPQAQPAPPSSDASASGGVAGAWAHREMPVRYLETMNLAVTGEHVAGTGTYMMEGGRSGSTTIAGTWRGGTLTLDITRDTGVRERWTGRLEAGKLAGQLTIDGNTQPFAFERPQP